MERYICADTQFLVFLQVIPQLCKAGDSHTEIFLTAPAFFLLQLSTDFPKQEIIEFGKQSVMKKMINHPLPKCPAL